MEWEAERTSGVVQIKPSGWGTKVTLSVTRELELLAQPEPEDSEDIPAPKEPELGAHTPLSRARADYPRRGRASERARRRGCA